MTNIGMCVRCDIKCGCKKYDSRKWTHATATKIINTVCQFPMIKAVIVNGTREIMTPKTGINPRINIRIANPSRYGNC